MMHEREKSDPVVVAVKPMNKAEKSAAELVEPRTGTKGNAGQQSMRRAQDRGSVSQALSRVRNVAKQGKKEKFTTLFHHLDPAMLHTAFFALKKDAAPGVDGLTWETYEADLDPWIGDLHERLHRGAYRAQPVRRRFIPKPDGSLRPLAITALEDKIVQRATAAVLRTDTKLNASLSPLWPANGRTMSSGSDSLNVAAVLTSLSSLGDRPDLYRPVA